MSCSRNDVVLLPIPFTDLTSRNSTRVCWRLILAVLIGCAIGFQLKTLAADGGDAINKVLETQPSWTKVSRRIITFNSGTGSGLEKVPFPDVNNPVHVEIWNLLNKQQKIADGFGTICDYFGVYLINISVEDDLVASYFYNKTNQTVYDADETAAFIFYKGNKTATIKNAVDLARAILGVTGEEAIIVTSAENIPHTRWQKNHPRESFGRYLLGKGISIHSPEMYIGHEKPEGGWEEYTECNVFAYFSHGGGVVRYEVQCKKGRIVSFDRFVLGNSIGDCWFTM